MEDPFFWKEQEIYELKQQLKELKKIYCVKILVYSIVSFIPGFVIAL